MKPVHVLEAPPCEACGKPIDELTMGLIVWDRVVPGLGGLRFDGVHLFHKGRCDPGGSVYEASHEISVVSTSPEELLYVQTKLIAAAAEAANGPEHWSTTVKTLLWLQTIALQLATMAVAAGETPRIPTGGAIDHAVAACSWPARRGRTLAA